MRTIEQQRLLAIREQMRFAMNLTMTTLGEEKVMLDKIKHSLVILDDYNLFTSNNFDDLLNNWDHQNRISIDHWSHFPCRSDKSQHDTSLSLLDEIKEVINEYYNHRQIISNNKNTTFTRISDQLETIDYPNDEFLKRMDSITSNITHSHI